MKKSTLIGLLLGALALASCSSYGGAHGGTYRSGASVVIGVQDYDYGYRSTVFRPGFYHYGGYYYPNVHPYYRDYHRNYRQWRHWNARDWAYYERHHRNWRSYRDWHPAKHWQPRKHDRKAWAKYERDRKEFAKNRHPARDKRKDWRPGDRDRKDWNRRAGNRHPNAQAPRVDRNWNRGERVQRTGPVPRHGRERNR